MAIMKTLTVDLADRSYPIFIGESLISNPELFTLENIKNLKQMKLNLIKE